MKDKDGQDFEVVWGNETCVDALPETDESCIGDPIWGSKLRSEFINW